MKAVTRKAYRSAIKAGLKVVDRLLKLLPEDEEQDDGTQEEIRCAVSNINSALFELQLLTQED